VASVGSPSLPLHMSVGRRRYRCGCWHEEGMCPAKACPRRVVGVITSMLSRMFVRGRSCTGTDCLCQCHVSRSVRLGCGARSLGWRFTRGGGLLALFIMYACMFVRPGHACPIAADKSQPPRRSTRAAYRFLLVRAGIQYWSTYTCTRVHARMRAYCNTGGVRGAYVRLLLQY
jgi:hypothetical protein